MENLPINFVNKVELPKTEQSVEHFSFPEQKKNIQEVFKLSPDLKQIAYDSLGIENDKDIVIELGRSKENNLGKIQNINVYRKGEKIIDSDGQDSSKLYLVTKEDGTSYVGDIFLPTELQGQGLGKKILQKVSDTLDTKIVPTYLSTGGFTSDNAKKMWKKAGNEILPNHEAEKLYAEYLKTIFPESKLQEVVYHGTNRKFDKFEIKQRIDDLSGIDGVDNYYFTDNIKLANFFAEKYKKVLYTIYKSYESDNVDWYLNRQENAGGFSEFKDSTKELWDNIYKEWEHIVQEVNSGKKIDEILKEPDIKYFENKEEFGFRFGKMLLPYYLMSDYDSYKTYPDYNIVPVLLDLKKPYIKEGDRNSIDGILSEAGYKHKKEDSEIDGVIQQDTDEKNIVVFRPEQIHVLGSETDIKKFKEFIVKNKEEKNNQIETSVMKNAYELLGADSPLNLSLLYTQEDQKLMKSQAWDYNNENLVINKVKNILENVDVEKLSSQEKEWRNEILWFWYHHAISCAIWRYKDKEKAKFYSSKALEFQDNHNQITKLLYFLVNNKIDEAEKWASEISDEAEKETASSLIKEFKNGQFF